MPEIIDGIVFHRVIDKTRLRATLRPLGDHIEASLAPVVVLKELDAPEPVLQYWRERLANPTSDELRKRAARAREQSALRRRTMIRRRVKTAGHDLMLTGTFKANMADLGEAWRLWKEFVRRVRRVWPGFSYCVAWEQQKRGAWHWHASTHNLPRELRAANGVRVKSFNVLRAIWRGVVGDLGGTVHVAKRQRSRRATQQHIAGYLAKYIGKAESAGDGSNRWASSVIAIDAPLRQVISRDELVETLAVLVELCGSDGRELSAAWVSYGDTVFLAAGPPHFTRSRENP